MLKCYNGLNHDILISIDEIIQLFFILDYAKVFEWEQYLIDIIDIPAPYELFTQVRCTSSF